MAAATKLFSITVRQSRLVWTLPHSCIPARLQKKRRPVDKWFERPVSVFSKGPMCVARGIARLATDASRAGGNRRVTGLDLSVMRALPAGGTRIPRKKSSMSGMPHRLQGAESDVARGLWTGFARYGSRCRRDHRSSDRNAGAILIACARSPEQHATEDREA